MNDVEKVDSDATRRPVSHRAVWVGLVALALVILGVFGGGYWFLVRYEPKAVIHVPETAVAALRVDVEQVVLYEPIRKHLFPVLDGGESGERLERFEALSGVNLGMDLREIVVAVQPDGELTVAIGGLFPVAGLVQALYQISLEGNGEKCQLEGTRLRCGSGLVQQANDGTLIIATSELSLQAATREGDWAVRNGLPKAPLAAVVTTVGIEKLKTTPTNAILARFDWLRDVERLTALTDLGDPLRLELGFDGLAPERASEVRDAVALVQAVAGQNPGADVAGEREILSELNVDIAAGRPVARSTWSRQDVGRAVRALADSVAAVLRPFRAS